MSEGVKHDQGKTRLGLLSTKWLIGVGKVLTFGAQKYSAHNWRGGIAYSRLTDAALRHLLAFNDGEDKDPETGLSHLYHASCCLMFLAEMSETRKDMDDRYSVPVPLLDWTYECKHCLAHSKGNGTLPEKCPLCHQ